MKEIKIYISLSEAESLVFNKILNIATNRLSVQHAQKDWAIAVYLNDKSIQLDDDFALILSGNVKRFEIPDKEESLFSNHFKIPKGLYSTKNRNYRDAKERGSLDMFDGITIPKLKEEQIRFFKGVRRGLLQCYQLAINEKVSETFASVALSQINSFKKWDEFTLSFINEVVSREFYPSTDINDGKFHTEAFKRFVWLGKYTIEHLSNQTSFTKEQIDEGRQWLKSLHDKDDAETVASTIKNVPLLFEHHYEFLLGYYFASSFYEESNVGEGYFFHLQQILESVGLGDNTLALFWAIFFQSIFKAEIDFLYFIPSLHKNQEEIEREIVSMYFPNIEIEISNIQVPALNEYDRLVEYIKLTKGGNLKKLNIISHEELKNLYKNNINALSLRSIGLEYKTSTFSFDLLRNKCQLGKNGFSLALQGKPAEVTFYLTKDSELDLWLRELRIKTKPIRKLIDTSKKVLVGFIELGSYGRSLLSLYEYLVNELEKDRTFKESVIVLMVDESLEYVQSVDFQREKLKIEDYCRSVLGNNCHVLVKNVNNSSDGEIKRNLKHVLEKYQIKQIELVDDNIDDKILEWMISANLSYVLDSNVEKAYSIFNL